MKARVKATGEIVEVMGTTQYDNYDVISKDGVYFSLNQLELIGQSLTKNKSEDEDYWEKLKHQYAGMAMQGLLSNPQIWKDWDEEGLVTKDLEAANMADYFATALVNKLKGE